MITLQRCPYCIVEVETVCYQINVSVIERGVRYIVGGLYKVGILRLIELPTTLKYLYFWVEIVLGLVSLKAGFH